MTELTVKTSAHQQAEIKALDLPEFTREQVKVNNELARLQPFSFSLENHTFNGRFVSDDASFFDFLSLSFSLSGQSLTLSCDQAMTALLVKDYLPEEALLFLPETLRIATLQAALAPFLQLLQQSTNMSPTLDKAPVITKQKSAKAAPAPGIFRLFGQINSLQSQGSFCLDLPQALYQQLIPLVATASQSSHIPWQQLPHSCGVILAQTRLNMHQLARLQHQDVVFFDTCYYREENPLLLVNISEQLQCLALADNNGLTVQEILTNANGNNDMNNEQIAMDEIPVTLTFEAGNLTLPLGELNQLSSGHVFAFDSQTNGEQAIQIRANGQLIGTCSLVSVAGKLGAKITRLNSTITAENESAESRGQQQPDEALPAAEPESAKSSEAAIQEIPAEQATQE
ncbi:type III secretion system cytoplasmic ring protein SctQ [Thalassomonas actiniarum]|uniref:Type III secretion system cytoplasmic ring protein SctQ n=1 Tax=Thalassomonas actiniarum TaxID=485447 RepID=A0AAF0C1D9_9GAMM|nr:type III secretion system cytoplasmic ring protein SctQ [Thalassomonas actiniarum]WDD96639.1 type III secretion system cytoplasmic ring protein SctQ [Thalassomonas actiniarum]